jgi:hypothetical protein
VSEPLSADAGFSPERKLSGTTRVLLAFVLGTLFALLPMYYVYTGSDAARRAASASPGSDADPASNLTPSITAERAAEPASRFAARMTYELSQTPEEPSAAQPRLAAVVQPAASPDEGAAPASARVTAEPAQEPPPRRVSNARPISSTPPEPRDTTRAIEKEARRARDAEPRPSSRAMFDPVQPRVFEGRDIVLPPPRPAGIATRAIGTSAPPAGNPQESEADPNRRLTDSAVAFLAAQERKQIEAQAVIAGGGAIAGVTPIGPPPDAAQRGEVPQKSVPSPVAGEPARGGAAEPVESRLAATREWLTAAPQTTHTIQILGTSNEEQLKGHLKSLSRVLEPNKIYVFRTIVQGKPAMTVVYGAYADRQAALQALDKLPPSVTAYRPVVRTVNGIRTEMKQHGIRNDS